MKTIVKQIAGLIVLLIILNSIVILFTNNPYYQNFDSMVSIAIGVSITVSVVYAFFVGIYFVFIAGSKNPADGFYNDDHGIF